MADECRPARGRQVVVSEVLVVGGGIGGLAAAFAQARAGRSVRVLERSPEFGEVGAGLQLGPNATRALAAWGLLDRVVAAGVLPRRLVFRDALTGEELTHLDLGEEFRRRYGAPYVVAHRSDLHAILLDACAEAGVELLNGQHVERVTTEGERARALRGRVGARGQRGGGGGRAAVGSACAAGVRRTREFRICRL